MLLFLRYENRQKAITYKCGRVVLSRISVYFVISKLTVSFSYSFREPCTILPNISSLSFFLIDHNRKQVLLIKWFIFICLKFQPSVS